MKICLKNASCKCDSFTHYIARMLIWFCWKILIFIFWRFFKHVFSFVRLSASKKHYTSGPNIDLDWFNNYIIHCHIQHYSILHKKHARKPFLIFPCKFLLPATGWSASWSSLKGKIRTGLHACFFCRMEYRWRWPCT